MALHDQRATLLPSYFLHPHKILDCANNGRQTLNRPRCAPIHVCGGKEAVAVCVPEVAAGPSATAILGICRMYAFP